MSAIIPFLIMYRIGMFSPFSRGKPGVWQMVHYATINGQRRRVSEDEYKSFQLGKDGVEKLEAETEWA